MSGLGEPSPAKRMMTRSAIEGVSANAPTSARFAIGVVQRTHVTDVAEENSVFSTHFPLRVDNAVDLNLLHKCHAAELQALATANLNRVQRYVNLGAMTTLQGSEEIIATMQESFAAEKGAYVGVFFHGELCGQLRLDVVKDPTAQRRVAKTGGMQALKIVYWLGDAFEGSGVLTRAIPAFLEHVVCVVWENVPFACVLADIKADNIRSKALVTRLGFVKSGIRTNSTDESWSMSLKPGWLEHMGATLQISRKVGIAQKWKAAVETANIDTRACQETLRVASEFRAGDMSAWFTLQERREELEKKIAQLRESVGSAGPSDESKRVVFKPGGAATVEVPLSSLQGWWEQQNDTVAVHSRVVVLGTRYTLKAEDGDITYGDWTLKRFRDGFVDNVTTIEWGNGDASFSWQRGGAQDNSLPMDRAEAMKSITCVAGCSLWDLQGHWKSDSVPVVVEGFACLIGRGEQRSLIMEESRWTYAGFRLREAKDEEIIWETSRGGRLPWKKIMRGDMELNGIPKPSTSAANQEEERLRSMIHDRSELLERQQAMLGEAKDSNQRAMVSKQIQVVEYELAQLQRSLDRLQNSLGQIADDGQKEADGREVDERAKLVTRIAEIAALNLDAKGLEIELEVLRDREDVEKRSAKLKDLELWRAEVARQGDVRSRTRSRMTHIETEIRRLQKEVEELEKKTAQLAPAVGVMQRAAKACTLISEDSVAADRDVIALRQDFVTFCQARLLRLKQERTARYQMMKEAGNDARELQTKLLEQHTLQAGWRAFGSCISTGGRGAAYMMQSALQSGPNKQEADQHLGDNGPAPIHYKALFRDAAATVKTIASPHKGQTIAMWVNLTPISKGLKVAIYSDDLGQTICLDDEGVLFFEQFRPALCVPTSCGISLDFWTHICVVVYPRGADQPATPAAWFINGEVIPSDDAQPRPASLSPLRGELREVQVYAGALEQADIRTLANFDDFIQAVYHAPSWQIYTQFGLEMEEEEQEEEEADDGDEETCGITRELLQGKWECRDGWRKDANESLEIVNLEIRWRAGEVEQLRPAEGGHGEWVHGQWTTCSELSGLPDMILWTCEDEQGDAVYSWWVRQ